MKYKKVRKALQNCTGGDKCANCPYDGREECVEELMRDAEEVMKKLRKKAK